ncbi:MAG: Lipoyltransferase and lipoate-protein ligase, partial [Mesotoga infera]
TVVDVAIYSDSMDVDFIEHLRQGLTGVDFSKPSILEALHNLPKCVERDDIIDWLHRTDLN